MKYVFLSSLQLMEDFNAKLRGFGLAKNGPKKGKKHVTTSVVGTHGYAAPEYIAKGHLSTKCDIYALGMVLLETITGQKAMDLLQRVGQKNLPKWAARIGSNKRNRKKKMDPRLEGMYPQKSASKCSALASRCIANNPKHRPSGEQVLQSLEQIYALD
ncbi:hypothetical protein R6Q57_002136 [Mikania cordata]